jgi:uncharacterized membrane protein
MKLGKIFLSVFVFILAYSLVFTGDLHASCDVEDRYKGVVTDTEDVSCEGVEDGQCITYSVDILDGDIEGESITVNSVPTAFGYSTYDIGDKVYITGICGAGNEVIWGIAAHSRESSIFLIIAFFVLIVFLVSGKKGLGSVLGLLVSFLIIYLVMVPLSIKTGHVLLWGLISVVLVLTISIYLSHGFNKKSSVALICTIIGLVIVGILGAIFMHSTKLTGFGNEEMYMLLSQLGTPIPVKEILFIGILISGIGVLDDVTVSQVGTVIELSKANPNMNTVELFKSSMNIGKDHIASMVNTLFIAYAGSSLSLIMLMNANGTSWYEILNTEFFAEEIVRSVISSMGLVLIVPITAYVSSIIVPQLIKEEKI